MEMASLTKLATYDDETGDLNVIVETPQGSRNKYKYDPEGRVLRVGCLLPKGIAFPYDFGFIPSTLGDDGDPLDILVVMEEPAPGGCLVTARLIGVIEAKQTENGGKTERNDRLVAVSTESHRHREARTLDDLGDDVVSEIEHFFVSYNELHGKKFKPIGRHGPKRARKLVKEGEARFKQAKAEQQKQRKKLKT
jgi:inorganic pyrophosphatase